MATTSHHNHFRSDQVGTVRRPPPFFGIVLVALAVAVINLSVSSGDLTAVDVGLEPAIVDVFETSGPASALLASEAPGINVRASWTTAQQRSVLLDGEAFATAVNAAIADQRPARSILLDGAAFERAVNEAVEFLTNGSALLDGAVFADAVADAVRAISD